MRNSCGTHAELRAWQAGRNCPPPQRVQELAAAEGGAAGPLIFAGAYVAATVALLPASVLTLAAGYLYGPLAGTAIVSVASTTACAVSFLISRYLVRTAVSVTLALKGSAARARRLFPNWLSSIVSGAASRKLVTPHRGRTAWLGVWSHAQQPDSDSSLIGCVHAGG